MLGLKLWNQRRLHSNSGFIILTAISIVLAGLVGACGFNEPTELVTTEPLPIVTSIPPTAIPVTTRGKSDPKVRLIPEIHPHRMTSLADVVEKIRPWVVSITTESFRRGFFTTFRDEGAGSGIVIRADGYILTNEHVVRSAQEIEIHLPNGDSYGAIVVGTDIVTDLAVLKIAAKELPSAKLAESGNLRPELGNTGRLRRRPGSDPAIPQ